IYSAWLSFLILSLLDKGRKHHTGVRRIRRRDERREPGSFDRRQRSIERRRGWRQDRAAEQKTGDERGRGRGDAGPEPRRQDVERRDHGASERLVVARHDPRDERRVVVLRFERT